ncbi:hypothetical protein KY340_04335 [Candidatus Woesearchaeota archaeon]|nr:hypothetical protein [Candidatus Woesearchaeota archaeon]
MNDQPQHIITESYGEYEKRKTIEAYRQKEAERRKFRLFFKWILPISMVVVGFLLFMILARSPVTALVAGMFFFIFFIGSIYLGLVIIFTIIFACIKKSKKKKYREKRARRRPSKRRGHRRHHKKRPRGRRSHKRRRRR